MSVRLPVKMVDDIKQNCVDKGISTSDFIKDKVVGTNSVDNPADDVNIDAETQAILFGLAGGGILGVTVYKGVNSALGNSDKEFSEDQKKMYATICALICALLSFFIINKYFSKK